MLLSVGIGLAVFSLRDVELSVLLYQFEDMNPLLLALAGLLSVLSHLLRSYRWQLMMKQLGHTLSPAVSFMAVMTGYFANLVPPRVGEMLRCGIASRYSGIPLQTAVGTVVAERIIDTLILLFLFGLNIWIEYEVIIDFTKEYFLIPLSEKFGKSGLLVAGISLLVAVAALITYLYGAGESTYKKKIREILKGFSDGVRTIGKIQNPFIFWALTVCIWLSYYSITVLFFLAFPAIPFPGLAAVLSVFIFGTVGMIVTPGGTGAYPALVSATLSVYGIIPATGSVIGWIMWGTQTTLIILFGIISLILLPLTKRN